MFNVNKAAEVLVTPRRPLTHLLDQSERQAAMNATAEQWRWIPGYEGIYEVSDLGRVRSYHGRRGQRVTYRRFGVRPDGHLHCSLHKDKVGRTRLVHQLVLEAFVGPTPEGAVVRHLDGDPANNTLVNLVYGSQSENIRDAVKHGTHKSGRERTHCKYGHAYTEDNTYWHWNTRYEKYLRECRTCRRERPLRNPRPPLIQGVES